jgi:hypothetical protein
MGGPRKDHQDREPEDRFDNRSREETESDAFSNGANSDSIEDAENNAFNVPDED